jgi:hypothetical protein
VCVCVCVCVCVYLFARAGTLQEIHQSYKIRKGSSSSRSDFVAIAPVSTLEVASTNPAENAITTSDAADQTGKGDVVSVVEMVDVPADESSKIEMPIVRRSSVVTKTSISLSSLSPSSPTDLPDESAGTVTVTPSLKSTRFNRRVSVMTAKESKMPSSTISLSPVAEMALHPMDSSMCAVSASSDGFAESTRDGVLETQLKLALSREVELMDRIDVLQHQVDKLREENNSWHRSRELWLAEIHWLTARNNTADHAHLGHQQREMLEYASHRSIVALAHNLCCLCAI